MKKKLVAIVMSVLVTSLALAGCGQSAVSDKEAADKVAALIDAIYVQERTETTDEDCIAAKKAWDALTDAQKELVEGEEADPDYFGRDTGDASLDDALNADDIGENEILVVSFGTSFNDSRAKDISGIEKAIQGAFPDWSVRRAFTAQIIINHVQAREGEAIDNMQQALDRAVNNGVKNLVVQPTHLMHGAEYDEMVEAVEEYADKFDSIIISEPMLGEVGSDATVINEDKAIVAQAVVDEAVKSAGYGSADEAAADGVAFVFMGHGTSHTAKVTYSQMQTQLGELGFTNTFVGTVEGEPEETACENVIEAVKEAGFKKVVLRPLMVVAGDHANNDMAGDDDDSWKSMFTASGYFDSVDTQIEGLGRIERVKQIYIDHLKAAMSPLEDGTYTAKFDTDSSMFHVNEACDGNGTLTVADGKMTLHIVMPSKNVVNLYLGLADDAQADGAILIAPSVESVTYSDGMTEEVNAFDVPVPVIGKEFDLALIGTKGVWYDHKVVVSNPVSVADADMNADDAKEDTNKANLEAGEYAAEVTLEGGTGKATVESPTKIVVDGDKYIATISWSSPHYDYMIVGDEKYYPVNTDGNSVFEIPVQIGVNEVIADTVAMSTPHEIEYTLTFSEPVK